MVELKARFACRRDTLVAWSSANPTLLEGETGLETDTGRTKVGDGSAQWNDLPYQFGGLENRNVSNIVSGSGDLVIGINNSVDGDYSCAIGTNNSVDGDYSCAIGTGLVNSVNDSLVVGRYNNTTTVGGVSTGQSEGALFSIGYGTDNSHEETAFAVFENGLSYTRDICVNVNLAGEDRWWGLKEALLNLDGRVCLIEGTKISMYDGTTKLIEDIKTGEVVKSYDPATAQIVPAVVMANELNGASYEFTSYITESGRFIGIYGHHCAYVPSIGLMRDLVGLAIGTPLLNEELEEDKLVAKHPVHISGRQRRRYNLFTNNSLYFANGILSGMFPSNVDSYFKRRSISLPLEINNIFEICNEVRNNINLVYLNDEFLFEVAPINKIRSQALVDIKNAKAALRDSDYKTLKYIEGELPEEEYLASKALREQYRQDINTAENIFEQAEADYNDILAEYTGALNQRVAFEEIWTLLNNNYELFKTVFVPGFGEDK